MLSGGLLQLFELRAGEDVGRVSCLWPGLGAWNAQRIFLEILSVRGSF